MLIALGNYLNPRARLARLKEGLHTSVRDLPLVRYRVSRLEKGLQTSIRDLPSVRYRVVRLSYTHAHKKISVTSESAKIENDIQYKY